MALSPGRLNDVSCAPSLMKPRLSWTVVHSQLMLWTGTTVWSHLLLTTWSQWNPPQPCLHLASLKERIFMDEGDGVMCSTWQSSFGVDGKKYLHNITTRQCWHSAERNLHIVILYWMLRTLPRSKLRLGTVSEVIQGKDGLVRRATILFGEKELNHKEACINRPALERPVQKLVLLLEAV